MIDMRRFIYTLLNKPTPSMEITEPSTEKPTESSLLEKSSITIAVPTTYSGSFAIITDKNSTAGWHSCRETFADAFKRATNRIVFSHRPKQAENIQLFFSRIEDILKLKKNRTKIKLTSRNNISEVEVPNWWRKYSVRRNLFTILLRSAQNFKGNNFKDALYSDKYAKATKKAIEHFLKGNTFAKKGYGWRDRFSGLNDAQISGLLTKPPRRVVEVLTGGNKNA